MLKTLICTHYLPVARACSAHHWRRNLEACLWLDQYHVWINTPALTEVTSLSFTGSAGGEVYLWRFGQAVSSAGYTPLTDEPGTVFAVEWMQSSLYSEAGRVTQHRSRLCQGASCAAVLLLTFVLQRNSVGDLSHLIMNSLAEPRAAGALAASPTLTFTPVAGHGGITTAAHLPHWGRAASVGPGLKPGPPALHHRIASLIFRRL